MGKIDEIYILSQMIYNSCEETYSEILGAFSTYRSAENELLRIVKENVKDFNFVEDKECTLRCFDLKQIQTRLFYHHQENWDNYIEISIDRLIINN